MSEEVGQTPTPSPAPAPAGGGSAADMLATPPVASWRDGLAEDLRGNAVFANYQSLDDFAKGHLSTKALASSKVPMPGDTPESFKAFADAIRPEDPAAYEITVPEGMPTKYADGFRAKAHELGLQPFQAKALADWNNEEIGGALTEKSKASAAEIDQFKSDYAATGGNFDQKLDAVKDWLPRSGLSVSPETLAEFDDKFGSANLMRFIFDAHDAIGDLATPPPGESGQGGMGGAMSPAQADTRLGELYKDASWRQKAQVEGSAEYKENARLTRLVAQGRAQERRGPK